MPSIFQWDCSYYLNQSKRWVYGKMFLYENCVKFIENDSKTSFDRTKVVVQFTSINSIRKANSSLIYSCVVFAIKDVTLWFSSFRNRDHVVNYIEHFWKGWLLGDASRSNRPTDNLMRIVYDTQDTLMNAASTLHKQGQQLNKASETMNSLADNIKVAERITEDINSWFGAWRVKTPFRKSNHKDTGRSNQKIDRGRIEYPILYAKHQQESHSDGYAVIIESGFQICNNKSEVQYTFLKTDKTKVDVHSPFDITLTNRYIGKSDTKLHLVSNEMPHVLKTLKRVCEFGYEFSEVPEGNPVADELSNDRDIGFQSPAAEQESTNIPTSYSREKHGNISAQSTVQEKKNLSSTDADQLSSVLQNIKSLAVDISVEQDAQIEQIDSIKVKIDRAETKLTSANYKINKML